MASSSTTAPAAASKSTAETEEQILSSFLLARASLKDIIGPREFADLFPKEHRSNPQVKLLYRELQLARSRQCAQVKNNIHREARLGPGRIERTERVLDDESRAGIELFGAAPQQPMLPLKELLQEMSLAADDLEYEDAALASECDAILDQIRTIVGDLSDLRYGKLAEPGITQQVTREIDHLVDVCERATASK